MLHTRTIREAAAWFKSQDPQTCLTETAIRTLLRSGRVPCVRVGKKYLVTIEALEAAKAKGIQIFISTGRPRVIINNLAALQERKLIDGYITMNGAYCFVDGRTDGQAVSPQTHCCGKFPAGWDVHPVRAAENRQILSDAHALLVCVGGKALPGL